MKLSRRHLLVALPAMFVQSGYSAAQAQTATIWSAQETHDALVADQVRLLDIRSREEWRETGVADQAWPVSMHESGFPNRLFTARELAAGRPVAMICATGGRTRSVMQALAQAEYSGFVDVSEGMLGSPAGRGWIAAGLPIGSMEEALSRMPPVLL